MTLIVLDASEEKRLKAQRAATGADRFDEVWDGVYVMSPLANNEHQLFAFELGWIVRAVVPHPQAGTVFTGVNVSDREKGWKKNYRCPDVAAFLQGTTAKDCGTHWCGGPDFGVEVVSPKDRSREKLGFYAKVGTRELLIVDRKPWRLELYRLEDGHMNLVGISTPKNPVVFASAVLPLTFQLVAGKPRPQLVVRTADGTRSWVI
jgi:Uma2 family endonuclease